MSDDEYTRDPSPASRFERRPKLTLRVNGARLGSSTRPAPSVLGSIGMAIDPATATDASPAPAPMRMGMGMRRMALGVNGARLPVDDKDDGIAS